VSFVAISSSFDFGNADEEKPRGCVKFEIGEGRQPYFQRLTPTV